MDEDGLKWNGQFIALEVPGTEKKRFVLLQAILAEGEAANTGSLTMLGTLIA